MNEIIYSLAVMRELVKRGHIPVATIPNPRFPQYNCWIFTSTDEFQDDLNRILGGMSNGVK